MLIQVVFKEEVNTLGFFLCLITTCLFIFDRRRSFEKDIDVIEFIEGVFDEDFGFLNIAYVIFVVTVIINSMKETSIGDNQIYLVVERVEESELFGTHPILIVKEFEVLLPN